MKTRYRNTDLHLVSHQPLDQLNQNLEDAGMIVLSHHQDATGDWNAMLEIVGAEDDGCHDSCENTIMAMMGILESLPADARSALDQCATREFNTAFDTGDAPFDYNAGLSAATISRMAALNASFSVTLYPHET